MLLSKYSTEPGSRAWCGRSWQGLAERRRAAWEQARALRSATDGDASRKVGDFLAFFESTGIALFRDEEEWVFAALRPVPPAVVEAMEDHVAIASLVQGLVHEVSAGCVDLRVVHRIGVLLERHLLVEEEKVRPLTMSANATRAL